MKKLLFLFAVIAMMYSCKKSVRPDESTATENGARLRSNSGGGGSDSVFTTQTYAGALGSAGLVNGALTTARFNAPEGVAFDSGGNLFVADRDNNCIRKITTGGTVSVFAGSASGVAGFTNGTGTAARFDAPIRLALDASDNIYVADKHNSAIRKITPAGVVTTFAGTGVAGFLDGVAASAKFDWPIDVAVATDGTVYVADAHNNRIRKISSGTVSTLAGGSTAGYVDASTGSSARFNDPSGLALGSGGNLVVADRGNSCIRRVLVATGNTSTYAGRGGVSGYVDGPATQSEFSEPYGIACTTSGTVYIADIGNHNIRMMTTAGNNVITTIAGSTAGAGAVNGDFSKFNVPAAIAINTTGNIFVADVSNEAIRKLVTTTRILRKTYGWTADTLATGLVWYRMSNVNYNEQHRRQIQAQNINVLDIDPAFYKIVSAKRPHNSPENTSKTDSMIAGNVAGINGTFAELGSAAPDTSYHVSFLKIGGFINWNIAIPRSDQEWWKHEGAIFFDFSTTTIGMVACDTTMAHPYDSFMYPNMISGGPLLINNYALNGVKDSTYKAHPTTNKYKNQNYAYPRTGIAITGNKHILLITVDGHEVHPGEDMSVGLSGQDFTQFLETYFLPQYALNFDGGGSTTMCIVGKGDHSVVNVPDWRTAPIPPNSYNKQRQTLTNSVVVVHK